MLVFFKYLLLGAGLPDLYFHEEVPHFYFLLNSSGLYCRISEEWLLIYHAFEKVDLNSWGIKSSKLVIPFSFRVE